MPVSEKKGVSHNHHKSYPVLPPTKYMQGTYTGCRRIWTGLVVLLHMFHKMALHRSLIAAVGKTTNDYRPCHVVGQMNFQALLGQGTESAICLCEIRRSFGLLIWCHEQTAAKSTLGKVSSWVDKIRKLFFGIHTPPQGNKLKIKVQNSLSPHCRITFVCSS